MVKVYFLQLIVYVTTVTCQSLACPGDITSAWWPGCEARVSLLRRSLLSRGHIVSGICNDNCVLARGAFSGLPHSQGGCTKMEVYLICGLFGLKSQTTGRTRRTPVPCRTAPGRGPRGTTDRAVRACSASCICSARRPSLRCP